jgi:exocyst complex protein 7
MLIHPDAPFPQIPGPRVAELRELNAFITTTQPRAGTGLPTIQTYSNVRGKYLATTLQNMATGSKDIPKKKSENDLYRQGESTINIYAQGIEGSFKAEWNNICNVFNRDQTGIIFELTTEKALNDYSKVIRDLNSQIKINITNDCFLAYEIIDVTNALAIQLDSVTGQLKQQVREVYKPIRDTAKNALVELIEDVRRRVNGMATLPPDGAAVGYTKEVLARLQNLMNFRDSVGSSMVSLGDHGWLSGQQNNTSRPLDVNPNRDELLANYIFDTLETLFSSLEARGNTLYKNRSLMGIFLANNVATAERMIRTSDLVAFVQHSPEKTAKLEGWRKKGVSAYVDAWREPSAVLRDVQYTSRAAPRPTSGAVVDSSSIVKALSSKEKDGYKEKFKMFNNSFDMLSAKHKELVPSMDRDIKTATAREIGAMVEPMYGRFWDRYHEIDKGKGKYVRWDKAGLAREIMQLG